MQKGEAADVGDDGEGQRRDGAGRDERRGKEESRVERADVE